MNAISPTKHVVDMRARPSFLHSFFGADPSDGDFEIVRWMNRRLGSKDPEHFTRAPDLSSFLGEMHAAGIDVAFMVGRSTPRVRISNDMLAEFALASKGHLRGVGSIDPQQLLGERALDEARRCVIELGLAGINVDPGFYERAIAHDHDSLLPIYSLCEERGVPVFVMSGPTTPDLRYNDPLAIDRIAAQFPKLPIICCHGFYPNIDAMIAVAFRRENVFVSPDMYLFAPGGERYADAARGFLSTQLLFGSSYPFRPFSQSVSDFRTMNLSQEAAENVAWRNAARLLGLPLT
ncbi:amidohydrolase family protein [Methylocystis bryophila]|uniref:Amidohydrolase n=1 Tax=Methylocystis bryophila TaxID=655015 RepID=A0A1W6MS53_9HYPH|nr:amidohydrolase family protein [Methylocystis bryophila]ARN80443.1 amidohydrolase [Methylocystis bryophila]BDV40458.1 hypothetical protein DSM21852_37110 [Methylocystis bryophila]